MTEDMLEETEAMPELAFGPGSSLRQAREERGMSIDDVAGRTRIAVRQLSAMEADDFHLLPGRTYALGFAKTYAKLVGLDEAEIVGQVREQLDLHQEDVEPVRASTFEPGDPARVPSTGLVWLSIAAIALLLIGSFAFYRSFFSPSVELPAQVAEDLAEDGEGAGTQVASSDTPPEGAVVFTALEEGIWVKFYDRNGTQLMQKQMAQGERYTVPADADGPQIWTGRPDALSITIGGQAVPKLAEEDQVMRDIPVTAEALNARGAEADTAE